MSTTPLPLPLTLESAKVQLQLWMDAETAVATKGQSYQIAGRMMTRADLGRIRDSVAYYADLVDSLNRVSGGSRIRQFVPFSS